MAADYGLLTQFTGPNIRGVPEQLDRSLKLADTIKGRRQKSELTDIFSKNVVQDQQGQSQLNKSGVLTDLYKVQPEKAFNLQEAWGKQDAEMQKNLLEKAKKEIDIQTKMFQMATPENYGEILQTLNGFGITPEGAPLEFQPEYIDSRIKGGLQAQQQFKRQDEEVARTAKQERQKDYKKGLSEFGSKFIPTVEDLTSQLKNKPELFRDLINKVYSSPHAGTKYADNYLKSMAPKGMSPMETLAMMMAKQNMTESKLTGEEKKQLGAVEGAVDDLNRLVNMYNEGDSGTLWSAAKSGMSDIPFIGERLFKGEAKYNKHRDVISERFLRAATGAAAPDAEVTRYTGFLPKWGSTPEQAQVAIKAFEAQIRARSKTAQSRLRAEGFNKKADEIDARLNLMFSKIKNILPKEEYQQSIKVPQGALTPGTTPIKLESIPTDDEIDAMSPEEQRALFERLGE